MTKNNYNFIVVGLVKFNSVAMEFMHTWTSFTKIHCDYEQIVVYLISPIWIDTHSRTFLSQHGMRTGLCFMLPLCERGLRMCTAVVLATQCYSNSADNVKRKKKTKFGAIYTSMNFF